MDYQEFKRIFMELLQEKFEGEVDITPASRFRRSNRNPLGRHDSEQKRRTYLAGYLSTGVF